MNKHLILIGFKHTGKSSIAMALAAKLNTDYIDLDQEIEKTYADIHSTFLSCYDILKNRGELYFRELEHQLLKKIMPTPPTIIALGGGTPLKKENQHLLQQANLIHITAPKDIVFDRIIKKGIPAFFPSNHSPIDAFNQLWDQRQFIYQKLANYTINNNESIEIAVDAITEMTL